MTDVEAVRERLAQMRALCENAERSWKDCEGDWYSPKPLSSALGHESEDAAYIAAASPDLMLRLVTEAEGVMDRHTPSHAGRRYCARCDAVWPCAEVEAVLRAWAP